MTSAPLIATLVLAIIGPSGVSTQPAFERQELAAYRLAADRFAQFQQASERIAEIITNDDALQGAPLLSQAVTQDDEIEIAAGSLEARLRGHAAVTSALQASKISAREFTKFAIALVGARLAHGFQAAGLLRSIPAGPAADNVAFVGAHLTAVDDVLAKLGVEFK
jgi:hypothetical protein